MSGNNLARQVQRSLLRRGKLTVAAYRALRHGRPRSARADTYNDKMRVYLAGMKITLGMDSPEYPPDAEERGYLNRFRQAHLREVIYHPTKGFRFRRGDAA